MDIGNWLTLIGLVVLWASSLIVLFVKADQFIKIKLTELDNQIKNNFQELSAKIEFGKKKFEEHQIWDQRDFKRVDTRIDLFNDEYKVEHKVLIDKIDINNEKINAKIDINNEKMNCKLDELNNNLSDFKIQIIEKFIKS